MIIQIYMINQDKWFKRCLCGFEIYFAISHTIELPIILYQCFQGTESTVFWILMHSDAVHCDLEYSPNWRLCGTCGFRVLDSIVLLNSSIGGEVFVFPLHH